MAPPEKESPYRAPNEKADPQYVAAWEKLQQIRSRSEMMTQLAVFLERPLQSLSEEQVVPVLRQACVVLKIEEGLGIRSEDMRARDELILDRLMQLLLQCNLRGKELIEDWRTTCHHAHVLAGLIVMYPEVAAQHGLFTRGKRTEGVQDSQVARSRAFVSLLSDPKVGAIPLKEVKAYADLPKASALFAEERDPDVRASKAEALRFLVWVVTKRQSYLHLQNPHATIVAQVLPLLKEDALDRYSALIAFSSRDPADISARLHQVDEMASGGDSPETFADALGLESIESRALFKKYCDLLPSDALLKNPPEVLYGSKFSPCCRTLQNLYALINVGRKDQDQPPWSAYLMQYGNDAHGEPLKYRAIEDLSERIGEMLRDDLTVEEAITLKSCMEKLRDEKTGELPHDLDDTVSLRKKLLIMAYLELLLSRHAHPDHGGENSAHNVMMRQVTPLLIQVPLSEVPEDPVSLVPLWNDLQSHITAVTDMGPPVDIEDPRSKSLPGWFYAMTLALMILEKKVGTFLFDCHDISTLRNYSADTRLPPDYRDRGYASLWGLSDETITRLRADPVIQERIQAALRPYDAQRFVGTRWNPWRAQKDMRAWRSMHKETSNVGEALKHTLKILRAIEAHNANPYNTQKIHIDPARLMRYSFQKEIAWDASRARVVWSAKKKVKLPLGRDYLDASAKELHLTGEPGSPERAAAERSLADEAKSLGYEMKRVPLQDRGGYSFTALPEVQRGFDERARPIVERARLLRREALRRDVQEFSARAQRQLQGATTDAERSARRAALGPESYALHNRARDDGFRLKFDSEFRAEGGLASADGQKLDALWQERTEENRGFEDYSERAVRREWKQLVREASEAGYNVASRHNFYVELLAHRAQEFDTRARRIAERVRAVQRRALQTSVERAIDWWNRDTRFRGQGGGQVYADFQRRLQARAERHGFTLTLEKAGGDPNFSDNGNSITSYKLSSSNARETAEYWDDIKRANPNDTLGSLRREHRALKNHASRYGCELSMDFERGSYKLGGPISSNPLAGLRTEAHGEGIPSPSVPGIAGKAQERSPLDAKGNPRVDEKGNIRPDGKGNVKGGGK